MTVFREGTFPDSPPVADGEVATTRDRLKQIANGLRSLQGYEVQPKWLDDAEALLARMERERAEAKTSRDGYYDEAAIAYERRNKAEARLSAATELLRFVLCEGPGGVHQSPTAIREKALELGLLVKVEPPKDARMGSGSIPNCDWFAYGTFLARQEGKDNTNG